MRIVSTILLSGFLATSVSAETFSADVWADNWFAFYVNGTKVAEDSVPITTERLFNSEREVGPKDGYDRIRWDHQAELIWGPDLETSDTICAA